MKKIEKGVTLIALVVTIIILLILAGLAIGSVTRENGLFQKATASRESSRGGEVKEYVSMTKGDNELAKIMNKPVIDKQKLVQDLFSKGKLTQKEVEELETVDVITIGEIEIDFSGLLDGDEILTLGKVYTDEMIGQKLTYSSNGQNEWIVFGKDEEGNILITTKEPIKDGYVVRRSVEAWLDLEDNLNAVCSVYGANIQGREVKSRSISIKDIEYTANNNSLLNGNKTFEFGTTQDYDNRKVNYLYPKKGATVTINGRTYENFMKATNENEIQTFTVNSLNSSSFNCRGYEDLIFGSRDDPFRYIVAKVVWCSWSTASFSIWEINDRILEKTSTFFYTKEELAHVYTSPVTLSVRPIAVLDPQLQVYEFRGII